MKPLNQTPKPNPETKIRVSASSERSVWHLSPYVFRTLVNEAQWQVLCGTNMNMAFPTYSTYSKRDSL